MNEQTITEGAVANREHVAFELEQLAQRTRQGTVCLRCVKEAIVYVYTGQIPEKCQGME